MKLLLKEDVEGLGNLGDEVEVKDGFGRNYLIPQGKAILATTWNVKELNHQKGIVQARLRKAKVVAEEKAGQIANVPCVIRKKAGENGKLFGSVTAQEIVEILRGQGVEVDRRKLVLPDAIKALGDFKVNLKLHPQVTVAIKVSVIAEEEEKKSEDAPEGDVAQESAPGVEGESASSAEAS
ncbi:MAG: 50S ribosomal protein L9 [Nitrospinae bacterium CG11_big_fil_rev_8_21_14_0_20_56_8]|nr:MAG: 50S ribosomal protein L9 [Nitrospinae bacterium CG11_big_fil_rev_8_21_14_0_20_56_8]